MKSLNNTNLNPEHYDTQRQIKVLREKIEKCKTVDEIKNRLQKYINTKTLEVTKGHKILLHDFVLEKLNEIVFKL